MSLRFIIHALDGVRGLSAAERVVLISLAEWANDDGVCWPSLDKIAARVERSRRYVIAVIDELEAKGHLTREGRHQRTTVYRLTDPAACPNSEAESTGEPKSTGAAGNTPKVNYRSPDPVNHRSPKPTNTPTNEPAKGGPPIPPTGKPPPKRRRGRAPYPDDFEAFWTQYPRGHGSKAAAYGEWRKLDPDADLVAEILYGLAAWQVSDRWQRGYIVDAERFLKRGLWENPAPQARASPARNGKPTLTEVAGEWLAEQEQQTHERSGNGETRGTDSGALALHEGRESESDADVLDVPFSPVRRA